MIFMCEDCREDNYAMGDERFNLVRSPAGPEKDMLEFTQRLCKKCVLMNMDITELFYKFGNPNYPDHSEYEAQARKKKRENAQ